MHCSTSHLFSITKKMLYSIYSIKHKPFIFMFMFKLILFCFFKILKKGQFYLERLFSGDFFPFRILHRKRKILSTLLSCRWKQNSEYCMNLFKLLDITDFRNFGSIFPTQSRQSSPESYTSLSAYGSKVCISSSYSLIFSLSVQFGLPETQPRVTWIRKKLMNGQLMLETHPCIRRLVV